MTRLLSRLLAAAFLVAPLLPLAGEKTLLAAEKSFRQTVEKDETIAEKRLFLSRYDLVRRLLASGKETEALREIVELRSEFSGRSLGWIAYLEARLRMKFGVEAEAKVRPLRVVVTNWLPVRDEWNRKGSNAAEIIDEVLPLSREGRAQFDRATEILEKLRTSPVPALREASAISRADLFRLRGEEDKSAAACEAFLLDFPASEMQSDVCFRLSFLCAKRRDWTGAIAWIERLQEFDRRSVWNELARERTLVIRSFVERVDRPPTDPEVAAFLDGYEKEMELRQDLAAWFERLARDPVGR